LRANEPAHRLPSSSPAIINRMPADYQERAVAPFFGRTRGATWFVLLDVLS
jgi:hypothetical protein